MPEISTDIATKAFRLINYQSSATEERVIRNEVIKALTEIIGHCPSELTPEIKCTLPDGHWPEHSHQMIVLHNGEKFFRASWYDFPETPEA